MFRRFALASRASRALLRVARPGRSAPRAAAAAAAAARPHARGLAMDISANPALVRRTVEQAVHVEVEGEPLYPAYMLDDLRDTAIRKFDSAMEVARRGAVDLPAAEIGKLIYRLVYDTAVDLARNDEDRVSVIAPDAPCVGDEIIHPQVPTAGIVTGRQVIERTDELTRLRFSFSHDQGSGKVTMSADYEVKRPPTDPRVRGILDELEKMEFYS